MFTSVDRYSPLFLGRFEVLVINCFDQSQQGSNVTHIPVTVSHICSHSIYDE